jgi:hypothetical protein
MRDQSEILNGPPVNSKEVDVNTRGFNFGNVSYVYEASRGRSRMSGRGAVKVLLISFS